MNPDLWSKIIFQVLANSFLFSNCVDHLKMLLMKDTMLGCVALLVAGKSIDVAGERG
jgi:hypothetical protein